MYACHRKRTDYIQQAFDGIRIKVDGVVGVIFNEFTSSLFPDIGERKRVASFMLFQIGIR